MPQRRPKPLPAPPPPLIAGSAWSAAFERARRMTGQATPGWVAGLGTLLVVLLLPVLTVITLAVRGGDGSLGHLAATVLPSSLLDTVLLVAGTVILSLMIGTGAAWLTTMYRFKGRTLLDQLLVLPLAIPIYILAFAYVDLLDYAGPVQRGLRSFFGWKTARDYMFPDIRSLYGAILVATAALYPYVYLAARASFVQQSVCVLEVARTLGRTPFGAFSAVALPLARPALAAAAALVAMECMNDFGAMQYLGVQTVTVAVYTTWLQRSSLPGAAQIALAALVLVAFLLFAERAARRRQRFHHTTGRYRALPFQDLTGLPAVLVVSACTIPVVLGFAVPVAVLAAHAAGHLGEALSSGFWKAMANSLWLAGITAAVAVAVALFIAFAGRMLRSPLVKVASTLAGLGYAIPGTVLALGLMLPFAALDNGIDALMRSAFGVSTGLLLTGSIALLVLAFTIRFLAVSLGAIESGLEKLSPNLDSAARTLGETPWSVLRRVHLPLILPALGSAALLVFVDAMKELPATLLLRPFNFETLATHVYSLAALEQFEAASLGALAIVLAGLIPVLILQRTIAGGRPANGSS